MSQVEKAFEAIAVRNVERAKHLIESGVDVNTVDDYSGNSLLHRAVFYGYAPMVGMLIQKGANVNAVNKEGVCPIHVAIPDLFRYGFEDGFVEVIKLLLEHGADVNAATKHYKNTPLHLAASPMGNNKQVVALLLEHGADVDALDHEGRRPIDLCQTDDISDRLKEAKAKKDMKAQPQQTMQQSVQPQQKINPSGPSFTPDHLL